MLTKSVRYAYPTSPIATKWNKPEGCYYVQIERNGADIGKIAHVFNCRYLAEEFADLTDVPYSERYLHYHPR